MRGATGREARRSARYQESIAAMQAARKYRSAMHEALRWLRAEAAHAEAARPRYAQALYGELAGKVCVLAEAVASATAADPASRAARRAGRSRRSVAAMRSAGRGRDALAEAALWLEAEAADATRHRPQDGADLAAQLTDRIARLATSAPAWRPARGGK